MAQQQPDPVIDKLVMRQLYGGAAEIGIPARMQDISDFRPVPDHQEVGY